jgi:RNase P subunit RPR2
MANPTNPVPQLQARLKYLNDSAHLLTTMSNNSSSYIMSQANALMFVHELEPPASHQRKVCNSCGNIMVLGRTAELTLQSAKITKFQGRKHCGAKPGKNTTTPVSKPKEIVYNCLPCGRETRYKIDSLPPLARRRLGVKALITRSAANIVANQALNSTQVGPKSESPATSANASAKQRKKARKQGGLQALLAKNREDKKEGFGLDLLDLMKKC